VHPSGAGRAIASAAMMVAAPARLSRQQLAEDRVLARGIFIFRFVPRQKPDMTKNGISWLSG
jgi:hypothetical protein